MNNARFEYKGRLEKIIFFFYLALLAWIPLPLASNRVWAWSIVEIWILVLCAGLCLVYLRGQLRSDNVFKKSRPVIVVFCCWLSLLLFQIVPLPLALIEFLSPERFLSYSAIGSRNDWSTLTESSSATLEYFIKSFAYVSLFVMSLLLVNSKRRIKLLLWTIICSALFQAMYGSLMKLSGEEYSFFLNKVFQASSATGTFINRNHLAAYLNMGLATGIGLLIAGLSKHGHSALAKRERCINIVQLLLSRKLQLRVFIALMTIALVSTHSRMGNAAFFVALSMTSVMALMLTRHARRTMAILVLSIIVIDVYILSAWFGLEKVIDRIQHTSFQEEQRDELTLYTFNQWQDYFILGSGGGTYQYVFPKYKQAELKYYYDHAHNDILEIASETGLIGISLLIIVVSLSFFTSVRAMALRHDPLMIGIAFTSIMGILALSIHSFVDFNFQIPANAATFVVLLALGWIARFHGWKKEPSI